MIPPSALLPKVDDAPRVGLESFDQLWFQVAGTRCNLECAHCFNESGPRSRAFGPLGLEQVLAALEESAALGVREVFFTGGEPFLNRDLPRMVEAALQRGPATVLTNATVLPSRAISALQAADARSRYSLEVRVSLDGESAERNDPIRGRGTFERVLAGFSRLHRAGFLPILTVTRTWEDAETLDVLARLREVLRSRGCERPRIKLLPRLRIGREAERTGSYPSCARVSREMLQGFDTANLLCSRARVVTDRGIWVCPILVMAPDARLGGTLAEAIGRDYALAHRACHTCYLHGAICSNFPDPANAG